jgi:hypothetical protein
VLCLKLCMGKKHDVMSTNNEQHMDNACTRSLGTSKIRLSGNDVRLMASDSNAEGIDVAEACMATYAHSPNHATSAMS